MTLKDALEAMDKEEFFLDELLDAVLDECSTKENRRWYARTVLDTVNTEQLKAELAFRENPKSTDPFYP
jgi:hypothetical protein